MTKGTGFGVLLVAVAMLLFSTAVQGAEGETAKERTKVIILVGGHGYDERGFGELWGSFDDIASEVWKGAPYTAFDDISDFKYDVIVMYNWSSGITDTQKQNFLRLLDQGVGLVVWHHALANCQGWPEFEKIAGGKFWMKPGERDGVEIPESGTGFGTVKMHIEDPDHAITKGVTDFETEDEPAWWNTPARRGETWPTWQILHYTFAGNDLTADKNLEFTWSDGGKYPPDELRQQMDNQAYPSQGSLLIGEAGSLLLPHVDGPQLFPKARFKDYPLPKLAPRNHYHHWIDTCLGKATTAAGFDYSGPLTETVLLGTVALLSAGKELAWDAARMEVTNVPEANQHLRRTYRDGWAVEGL